MATPAPNPAVVAQQKANLLLAVSQLDMLLQMFKDAPERVKKAADEFRDALKEWADAG